MIAIRVSTMCNPANHLAPNTVDAGRNTETITQQIKKIYINGTYLSIWSLADGAISRCNGTLMRHSLERSLSLETGFERF